LSRSRTAWAIAIATAATLSIAPSAGAREITSVFDGAVSCQPDGSIRFCGDDPSTVATWDGVPIDVNVALPALPPTGRDHPYPLLMMFHGWGGTKLGVGAMRPWAERGYAVFSMTDRGFGESCGATAANRLDPECQDGYIRLMDDRYEVRDAQEFAGRLVDERVARPGAIGATGGSYGGGLSMALAALRNRKMLPDGSLVPWTSPDGTPLSLAAAAPEIPWTDLAYSLMPNGHTLDYVADAPYLARNRIGVMKESFVSGLYAAGAATGTYAPPGTDPDADLTNWFALINAGEPYDTNPLAIDIVDEITTHHSSYYVDHSIAPAPLLISNGWTDDLFPPDEALRFYNRTRTEHPGAPMSLFFLDYGHQRGQNRSGDIAILEAKQRAWFDHYLRGRGATPFLGVRALETTCDPSDPNGPSSRVHSASSWQNLAPGEVRIRRRNTKTIAPSVTDNAGAAFDPIAGGGACATADGADQAGTANYRLKVHAPGYTLIGSPTVIADVASPGPNSQLAARLLDVAPDGDETLVARGLYRPEVGATASRQVFQLHADGWRFRRGHSVKLELLPTDSPYGRASNGQAPITVSHLQLRLPVLQDAGDSPRVHAPYPKIVPSGYTLAPGYH
jgi:hypothetical protein